jgi:hypothetical protein
MVNNSTNINKIDQVSLWDVFQIWLFTFLWKESLNSDGQQFHQY